MPGTLEVYVETYAKVAQRNPSVVQTFRGVAQEGMHIPQYVRSWCVRKRQIFGLRPIFPKYVVQFRNSFADSKFCPIHSATYGSRVFRIFRRLPTALGGFRWACSPTSWSTYIYGPSDGLWPASGRFSCYDVRSKDQEVYENCQNLGYLIHSRTEPTQNLKGDVRKRRKGAI